VACCHQASPGASRLGASLLHILGARDQIARQGADPIPLCGGGWSCPQAPPNDRRHPRQKAILDGKAGSDKKSSNKKRKSGVKVIGAAEPKNKAQRTDGPGSSGKKDGSNTNRPSKGTGATPPSQKRAAGGRPSNQDVESMSPASMKKALYEALNKA
jgi:hypothetical protein